MAIPWAAQQHDAELMRELADYDISLAAVAMAQSLLHLQRQLVMELGRREDLAQKAKGSGVLRWVLR